MIYVANDPSKVQRHFYALRRLSRTSQASRYSTDLTEHQEDLARKP